MHSRQLRIPVDGQDIEGTFSVPATGLPGVLFVHGWGGSQDRDLERAPAIAALGCLCLTFDLRGHAETAELHATVSRQSNLDDVLAAYDHLAGQASVDRSAMAIIGSSYGGYLAAIATALRPVRWLALRAPALYRDEEWETPKMELDKADLAQYRRSQVEPGDNRALAACAKFEGDVLIVASEHDDVVPRQTIGNYVTAFERARSLTSRTLHGADHGLTDEAARLAYTSLLRGWMTEMVSGSR